LVFQPFSFFRVFTPKLCKHLSPLTCMPNDIKPERERERERQQFRLNNLTN
jgi:hypothetical protein